MLGLKPRFWFPVQCPPPLQPILLPLHQEQEALCFCSRTSICLDSSSLNVWACFLSSYTFLSIYPFLKKEEKYSLSNKYLGDVQKWSELCSWANCYSWYSQWLTVDLGQKRGDLYSSDKFLFLRNQSHKQYSCWQDFPTPQACTSSPEIGDPAFPAFDRFWQTYFRLKSPAVNITWVISLMS